MDEQKEQSGENKAGSFSDETIRLFLLGGLTEEERARFDEALITDDELEARIRLAEFEITDDYAFNRLTAKERKSFEKFFLVTNERKQKLTASRALQNYTTSQTEAKQVLIDAETELSFNRKLSNLFGFKRPAFVFAVSVVALILFVGIIWFAARNLSNENENLIAKQETPTPQPSPKPETSPTPETSVSPKPTPKVTPTQIDSSTPATIATFVLLPGSLRDGGEMKRITLPTGERDIVRLELTLESNESATYRAELLTAEGKSIATVNKANSNSKVIVDIPVRLLKAGDYQIKLSRKIEGQDESIGRYYFRALKK